MSSGYEGKLDIGWYEFVKPNATTHIIYVSETSYYLPEEGVVTLDDFFNAIADGKTHKLIRVSDIENPDVGDLSKYWRNIPNFEGYKMNPNKEIIDTFKDNAPVPLVPKEGIKYASPSVMLRAGESCGHMNVNGLFRQTFPELVK